MLMAPQPKSFFLVCSLQYFILLIIVIVVEIIAGILGFVYQGTVVSTDSRALLSQQLSVISLSSMLLVSALVITV